MMPMLLRSCTSHEWGTSRWDFTGHSSAPWSIMSVDDWTSSWSRSDMRVNGTHFRDPRHYEQCGHVARSWGLRLYLSYMGVELEPGAFREHVPC